MPVDVTCPKCWRTGRVDSYVGGDYQCACEYTGPWHMFGASADPDLLVWQVDPVTKMQYATVMNRRQALTLGLRKVKTVDW